MKTFNFVCGGVDVPDEFEGVEITPLDVQGDDKNIELKLADISKTMSGKILDIHLDLVEVAAYVYCADQQTKRGTEHLGHMGRQWRRRMNFVIPVRCYEVWESDQVTTALENTLHFLSEDNYTFTFVKATNPISEAAPHFDFTGDDMAPDEVALFSGGVDSLAGAVEDIVGNGKNMVLVGHHSSPKVFGLQKQLAREFRKRGFGQQALFVPVKVTNSKAPAKEYTQRSRSFLFASLAIVVAQIYGKNRFTFYENGVISLNLPLSKDAMGARSTRTTHPRVIGGFEEIFSAVLGEDIKIDTPLQWLTKTEVTQKLKEFEFEDLLSMSSSCTRPYRWTKEANHCGLCSQCIDRRFASLAAGLADSDPASNYKIDLLLGDRSQDKEIAMAADYVRLAQKIKSVSEDQFASTFPEVFSAADHFEGLSSGEAIKKIYDLFRRHADAVLSVIDHGFDKHRAELIDGKLPSGCLLSLCFNRSKIEPVKTPDLQGQYNEVLDQLKKNRCDFFFDEKEKKVVFADGMEVSGANCDLLAALLENYRAARTSGGEVEYIPATKLADAIDVNDQTLRRRITRFQEEVSNPLKVSLGITDDLIENKHGVGYRLNPVLKEVFSTADLET